MGRLRPHGDTGGAAGRAHVLTSASSGEAIAYTLTFENPAPPWDADRRLGLPPRLAHIYVRQGHVVHSSFDSFARRLRRVASPLRCAHVA